MNNKRVGNWTADVTDPYPCWCKLRWLDRFDGSVINEIRFDHHDLADLEYIVTAMKREVTGRLPESDRHEI